MDSLRGKVALLTGAGGGLGSEMARALGREGVQLALSGQGWVLVQPSEGRQIIRS